MADGQVVLVTTEPLGGGSPVRSVYFVAEKDPEIAKAIIGAMMAPNEKVEAWGRLPEAAVKALGLKRGDFTCQTAKGIGIIRGASPACCATALRNSS